MAGKSALFGALFGLLPIGWIVLNVIFMYQLTSEVGLFDVLQKSITSITTDRRLQLLLVAFCFGAFFEGAAGFGTPVAVTAAIPMGLGFSPLASAVSRSSPIPHPSRMAQPEASRESGNGSVAFLPQSSQNSFAGDLPLTYVKIVATIAGQNAPRNKGFSYETADSRGSLVGRRERPRQAVSNACRGSQ